MLEDSGARLEHARAMADLGAALRRAGQRAESRDILRRALHLSHRHGAFALTERTRTELVAAGGRPRRLVLSGLDALTPGERRAAQLAAVGLSNREITQNLFVTSRTSKDTSLRLPEARDHLPRAAPRRPRTPCSGPAAPAPASP